MQMRPTYGLMSGRVRLRSSLVTLLVRFSGFDLKPLEKKFCNIKFKHFIRLHRFNGHLICMSFPCHFHVIGIKVVGV